MSTTDEDLARMIRRLQTYTTGQGGRYSWDSQKARYDWIGIPRKKMFPDKQIMEAFGLTQERFDELMVVKNNLAPRSFTTEEWKKRYFDFWDKHKRWHTRRDGREWRETGLCCDGHWLADSDWLEEYCRKRKRMLRKHPEMVFAIRNLTTRRNVITELGGHDVLVQTLIKQGKAEQLQQDDFGILWKLDFPDGQDGHMRYVEVVNTTPNPDGKHDHYFLRVPPLTTTAKAGVAWTFDKHPHEFVGFAAQS